MSGNQSFACLEASYRLSSRSEFSPSASPEQHPVPSKWCSLFKFLVDKMAKRSPPNVHKHWLTCFKDLGKVIEKRFKCINCDFRAKSRVEVQRHYSVHLDPDELPFVCDWPGCSKTFGSSSSYSTHKKNHKMRETDERRFACDENGCDFKTQYKCALDRHKENIHTKEKPLACPFPNCSYKAKYIGTITKHQKIHDPKRPKPFKCPLCKEAFYRNSDLNIHILTHTKEAAHECPYCPYSAPFESRIARHICPNNPNKKSVDRKGQGKRRRPPAKGKQYECQICEFTTDYIAKMKKHQLKVHRPRILTEKTKDFKCDLCDFRGKIRSSLENHMISHSQSRPYGCDNDGCDFRTKYQRNVKLHTKKCRFGV